MYDFPLVCHCHCSQSYRAPLSSYLMFKISWRWNLRSGSLRSLKMAPFNRSHTSSCSSSIVTQSIAVSCTVFEIKRDTGRKRQLFIPLKFNLHGPLEFLPIVAQNFNTICLSPWAIRWCKNIIEKFKYLPIGCNNVTDDRQTTDGRHMP